VRLLIVTQQLRRVRSGVGTYARTLVDGLRDLDLTVATWTDEHDPGDHPRIDLGEPPRWDPTPGGFWTLGRRLARALSGRTFEIVHFLDAREAHALRSSPGTLVGTVHDDYAAHAPRSPFGLRGRAADPLRRWAYYRWLERLERRTYARFDLICANSTATAQTLVERYGLPAAKVRTVSLCVPPPPESNGTLTLAGDPALLFVGGNFYRKGVDTLIRSLTVVRETRPGVHLHVVGRDRAQPRLESLARTLGVAVTLHGAVEPERVAAMMRAADQFVMPSRREALGLVFLESAAAGLPVIAGERGGVRDLITHGESGLLVPPEDVDALARAILDLAADPALRERLVAGARSVAAQRTPERLVEQTLEAYRAAGGA
jgi:glycosyltransferase involved in cell wall biosynthesis